MDYESKAIVTTIKATSRVALKLKDDFYTLEYTEERSVPDVENIDIAMERAILWRDVNNTVDRQVEETIKAVFGEE